jgi:DNA-binding MarR family transcriptional regulator
MQQLRRAMIAATPRGCAAEILEVVPAVMRFIRTQMRQYRGPDLSVPQFRTLVFLCSSPGASLSVLADFLGLSLPATSRLVEGLVRRNLVDRRIPSGNRRLVSLTVSAHGRKIICAARKATERRLADVMSALPIKDCVAIQRALQALRKRFCP